MEDIGKAFLLVIIFFVLIAILTTYVGSCMLFKTDSIRTKHRVEPELILTTDGKKIDTFYIYKKPVK